MIGSIFSLVISVLLEQKVHYLEMFVYSQLFIDIFLCSYVLNKAMVLTKDHLSDFFILLSSYYLTKHGLLNKMKILIVTKVFYPSIGGMENMLIC